MLQIEPRNRADGKRRNYDLMYFFVGWWFDLLSGSVLRLQAELAAGDQALSRAIS